jgi:predicted nucleic acid-binding protein
MKTVIVDASVAAKWFVPETGSIEAIRLLDGRYRLAAPALIHAEIGNLLWKMHSRKVIDHTETNDILQHFLSIPIEIHPCDILLPTALDIAIATGRTVYDSLYLSLAIGINGVVVTADERWVNALNDSPFAKYMILLSEHGVKKEL